MTSFKFEDLGDDATGYKVYVDNKYSFEIRKKEDAFVVTDYRRSEDKLPRRTYSSLETAAAYLTLEIVRMG